MHLFGFSNQQRCFLVFELADAIISKLCIKFKKQLFIFCIKLLSGSVSREKAIFSKAYRSFFALNALKHVCFFSSVLVVYII